ncbi:MAG: family 20 glycosylhydrolase [Akkermansiaceae bacterium]
MFRYVYSFLFLLLIFSSAIASYAAVDSARPSLLPMPQAIEWQGETIELVPVKMKLPNSNLLKNTPLRSEQLFQEFNQFSLKYGLTHDSKSKMHFSLRLAEVKTPDLWKGQSDQAYRLVVNQQGIILIANTVAGLQHGLQTLHQLMVRKDGKTTVAMCKIHDYPAFKIRGFMHDVGRNFQPLEQLKMQIDVLAAYKMNVFHFHVTEYFGWRLESKIYPKLTADSSFTRMPGKFYTQKEFVALVDYCWARGITLIPEFDSPGHSDAFRKGIGIKNMRDPKAKKAMVELIHELCSLVGKEKMPYIHIGTDEAHRATDRVNADYLPALHKAVHDNNREVIGWIKGMTVKGDKRQIQQTWAQSRPHRHLRHIDSRSNYVNHLEALDFATRMFFQQPCRQPHGNQQHLGGILAHWPDNRVDDPRLTLTNNPVIPAMIAYSEAVWKGIDKDRSAYWAKLPPVGSAEFKAYADFENRIAEHRDRFFSGKPFPFVKTHPIEWRLLGPVADGEVKALEEGTIQDIYHENDDVYRWTKPLRGGAIHVKHFFGFSSHLNTSRKGKDVVWANTYIHSDKDQEVGAWISFNTTSSSDNRAGVAKAGNWNANPKCNIWINGKRIAPPKWKNPGKMGKEFAFTNEIYTSRAPTKIHLKKGWNKVLIKSAPSWKWVFSFSPVVHTKTGISEVPNLRYSATPPKN